MIKNIIFFLIAISFSGNVLAKKPKNIILLIGDGMGLSQITLHINKNNKSAFKKFKNIGFIETSSANSEVTDSAAAATAFAIGKKTRNGYLGLDKNFNKSKSLIDIAKKNNLLTGIIVTSSITHATPGAFYAHQKSRRMNENIANDLIDADIDFFSGGGLKYFLNRKDKVNLLKKLEEKDYKIYTKKSDFLSDRKKHKKIAALISAKHPKSKQNGRKDYLVKSFKKAIANLSNPNGFLIIGEGSQIDWASHQNDVEYLESEMKDFDQLIKKALDFAKKDKNTLVIVTADHETGGLALTPKLLDRGNYGKIEPKFISQGHSAVMIPVFAYGPNAENFRGIYSNTDIFHKIKNSIED